MKNLYNFESQMTISASIMENTTERAMDDCEPIESLEERCLAINDHETRNHQISHATKIPLQHTDLGITSLDISESQRALARAIAESRSQQFPQIHDSKSEVKRHHRNFCAKDRESQEMDYSQKQPLEKTLSDMTPRQTSSGKSRSHTRVKSDSSTKMEDVTICDASTHDVTEELRAAKEVIRRLENKVGKLTEKCSTLMDANHQWAEYAQELKKEQTKATRSSSVDDIRRRSTSPKSVLNEMDTNGERYESLTRKSEGDLNEIRTERRKHEDSEVIKKLKSQITLLTQQVKIYRDDFALERRDRVRSVMEVKKLRQEVDRLKAMVTKQKQHAMKEQYIACDDFDYLNNH